MFARALDGASPVLFFLALGTGHLGTLAVDEKPLDGRPTTASATDHFGDPLPAGAVARMGTARLRPGAPLSFLVFSPDGGTLASADEQAVRLWDATTGKELGRFPCEWASVVAFAPDGKSLAAGSAVGAIRLWETATGRELRRISAGDAGKVHALAVSPDGKFLATGSADPAVRLWDTASGTLVRSFAGPNGPVDAVAFSPDGQTLAAGGRDVRWWEVRTGRLVHQAAVPSRVTVLAFLPGGGELAAGAGREFITWDPASGKELRRSARPDIAPSPVAMSPDGLVAAAPGKDGILCLFNQSDGKPKQAPIIREACDLLALAPAGKRLACARSEGPIHLWDIQARREVTIPGHRGRIVKVVFSPEGRTVTSVGAGGIWRQWEAATGRHLHFWTAGPHVRLLAVSPEGETLLFADSEGGLSLCDGPKGKELQKWRGPKAQPRGAALSADGNRFAVAYANHPVHLGDLSGPALTPLPLPTAAFLTFNPDGTAVAMAGADGVLRFWDLAAGRERAAWAGVRATSPPAFSADGRLLAVATTDGIISLWDCAAGSELRRLGGHPDAVFALAFSPDGRLLGSGGPDPSVRLWEVASGLELNRLAGHAGPVTALAFSSDGTVLVSGSADTTLLTWDITGQWAGNGVRVAAHPDSGQLETWWGQLAGLDGPAAHGAMRALAAAASESVPFLASRLRPFIGADADRIARLIADLDHDSYAVREKATADLEQLVKWAEPALRKVLLQPPSLEVQRRIEKVLEKLKGGVAWRQERLRLLRAIAVLEKAGSPAARQELAGLAAGAPDADLRLEAKRSLDRLTRKTPTASGEPDMRPQQKEDDGS